MTTSTLRYGKIEIGCACEKCGTSFDCSRVLESNVSDQSGNRIGSGVLGQHIAEALTQLEKERALIFSAFEKNDVRSSKSLPVKKCPQCGYYQSWMLNSLREKNLIKMSLGITAIPFLIIFFWVLVQAMGGHEYTNLDLPRWLDWLATLGLGIVMSAIAGVIANIATFFLVKFVIGKFYQGPQQEEEIPSKVPLSLKWIPIHYLDGRLLDPSWTQVLPGTMECRS